MNFTKRKSRDITSIAMHLPDNKISITVRKTSMNTVSCDGVGEVNVNDSNVQKAVTAFETLLTLGITVY